VRQALAILALTLAGCAAGGSNPPPQPVQPGPPPVPTFSADWTAPLGIALRCGGPGLLTPFGCDLPEGAKWGVLPQEGNGGMDCVDPQPNVCFQPHDGVLGFHAGAPGMALVSARTLDGSKPISVKAVVTVENDCRDVSYAGPVIYGGGVDDGDPTGTYAAAYISCAGPSDPVKVWIYRPTLASPISGPVNLGPHTLRIDYVPSRGFVISLDGAVILDHELGSDPLTFPNDPRPAMWFGNATGAVGRFDVFTGGP